MIRALFGSTVAAAILATSVCGPASAAVISYNSITAFPSTLPLDGYTGTGSVLLPSFSPTLGTLTDAQVNINVTYSGVIRYPDNFFGPCSSAPSIFQGSSCISPTGTITLRNHFDAKAFTTPLVSANNAFVETGLPPNLTSTPPLPVTLPVIGNYDIFGSIPTTALEDGGGVDVSYSAFTLGASVDQGVRPNVTLSGNIGITYTYDPFGPGHSEENDHHEVPEPASLALLGMGLLGMVGWKRSRAPSAPTAL